MTDSRAGEGRARGIFLSYAHEDRPFVQKLAGDLRSAGVPVWVDEGEIGLGDSLLEKITNAIHQNDYLGVVISPHSSRSEWVTREVGIAMARENEEQRVTVLPLVLRGGELPPALVGKIQADFSTETEYQRSLNLLLSRLVADRSPTVAPRDRLTELAASNPLLAGALTELRGDGLSHATADALVSARVADVLLSEFLTLAAREAPQTSILGLAISLPKYIDGRGVGHEALDHCISRRNLAERELAMVGMHMQRVRTPEAIVWCHQRLTTIIRSDAYYHSFLSSHLETVADRCFDQMTAYLLHPNRGPGDYNVDAFDLVIRHVEDPAPFIGRWREWIWTGLFDHGNSDDATVTSVLYEIFNERWDDPRYASMIDSAHGYVRTLLKSEESTKWAAGKHHLIAMVEARYRGADRVVHEIISRLPLRSTDKWELVSLIHKALAATAAWHAVPDDDELERRAAKLRSKVLRHPDSYN